MEPPSANFCAYSLVTILQMNGWIQIGAVGQVLDEQFVIEWLRRKGVMSWNGEVGKRMPSDSVHRWKW